MIGRRTSVTQRVLLYAASILLFQLAACSNEPDQPRHRATDTVRQERDDGKLVLAFGDSLYAGFGLRQDEAFPHELEQALEKRGIAAQVVNGGVSGDTTAAGLARLAFTLDGLPRRPDLVIVGLGANDMLRGLDTGAARDNLRAILDELRRRGIPAMLTGMLAAPNMGDDYAARFNAIYPELAKAYDVPLYPFFLDGVAGRQQLELPDGLHPNARGVALIVDRVTPTVANALLRDGSSSSPDPLRREPVLHSGR